MNRSDIETRVNEFIRAHSVTTTTIESQKIEKNFLILSGMSGSGKSTIGRVLEQEHGYEKLRNVYTRKKRDDETESDGIFVSTSEFHTWREKGELLIAKKTNAAWHGIRSDEMDKLTSGTFIWADKSVGSLLELGQDFWGNASMIYILPPDFATLLDRLRLREHGTTYALSEIEITARLQEEVEEMMQSIRLPYRYVSNTSIESCIATVLA